MKRILLLAGLLLHALPIVAQTPAVTDSAFRSQTLRSLDSLRAEAVRGRAGIRTADTYATRLIAHLDSLRAAVIRGAPLPVVIPPVVVVVDTPAAPVVTPPTPPVVITPPAPPVDTAPKPPVIVVQPPAPPPPVIIGADDVVQFPTPEIAFLLGPLLKEGSAANPWPWFDTNAHASGLRWTQAWRTSRGDPFDVNYYDVAMALYGEYYRSGDTIILAGARERADGQYDALVYNQTHYGGSSPRHLALTGVMLRAMDGKPNYWPFILQTVRDQYQGWLGLRLSYPTLYFGVRDGSYMLSYATMLARAYPDSAVRAEMRQKALAAADGYFLRLQSADGGWYWTDDSGKAPGGLLAQPFEVGLLLESLSYVHQLTGDTLIAKAYPRAVDWLQGYYRGAELVPNPQKLPNLVNIRWRNLPYFVYTNGTWNSATTLPGGWDTNTLKEARQANSTVVAAYGYAYLLTRDPKYRTWGDEMFAATYGHGKGPGADAYSNLADYQAKEYGQAYRSAGRYLVWRTEPN